ncbi:hypothetical protein QBC36DRAFT_368343 [Triangularia setosa]|uniref:Uncharacterized protein n=1 Tax=Triangularia setosa TaxID=2587417 RepID=A0AAN6VWF1_9PEZI|nr:hypothetical protein QBC36DRAFT_368343 [Podospora setosa]
MAANTEEQQGRRIEAAYHDIISPLAHLATSDRGSLHRFYAHLVYPWWAYSTSTDFDDEDPEGTKWWGTLRREEERLKEQAERMVLGDQALTRDNW